MPRPSVSDWARYGFRSSTWAEEVGLVRLSGYFVRYFTKYILPLNQGPRSS